MSTRVRHERMDIWLNRQLGIFFQFPLICQHVLNSNIENIWQPVWRVSVSISNSWRFQEKSQLNFASMQPVLRRVWITL